MYLTIQFERPINIDVESQGRLVDLDVFKNYDIRYMIFQ